MALSVFPAFCLLPFAFCLHRIRRQPLCQAARAGTHDLIVIPCKYAFEQRRKQVHPETSCHHLPVDGEVRPLAVWLEYPAPVTNQIADSLISEFTWRLKKGRGTHKAQSVRQAAA